MKINDIIKLCICVWIMLTADVYICESINIYTPSKTGLFGKNRVTLECSYHPLKNEEMRVWNVEWSKRKIGLFDFSKIVSYVPSSHPTKPMYTDNFLDISGRTELNGDSNSLNVTFNDVRCSDEGTYRCTVSFSRSYKKDNVSSIHTASKEMNFTLQAAPLRPFAVTAVPYKKVYKSHEVVKFTCTANIGMPPGAIWWFQAQKDAEFNITDLSPAWDPIPAGEPNSCIFLQESSISLVVWTSFALRCKIFHKNLRPKESLSGCDDMCAEFPVVVDHSQARREAAKEDSDVGSTANFFIGFTVFAVLCAIAGAVTYYVRRRKKSRERELSEVKYTGEFDARCDSNDGVELPSASAFSSQL